ncbi:lytic transglycosylase domain protein [Burkholderia pseudomallei MSHR4000]|nr:lytic transglycosylase domain protein [Burkholderia pseudomallei MSHR4000]
MMRVLPIVAAVLAFTSLPSRADCLDDAAAFHRVNPRLLRVIAQHESGMMLMFTRN